MTDASFSTVKDVVIFALAIYGAGLSTFNLIQAVRKDRRRVSVRVSTAMPTYGDTLGRCFAKIEAVNVGHRPVTIASLSLELPSGARLLSFGSNQLPGFPDTRLPAVLADVQTAHATISYADIAGDLVGAGHAGKTPLTPYCEDTVGTVYRGKVWLADPAEIAGM
jgi:hypothetical protein